MVECDYTFWKLNKYTFLNLKTKTKIYLNKMKINTMKFLLLWIKFIVNLEIWSESLMTFSKLFMASLFYGYCSNPNLLQQTEHRALVSQQWVQLTLGSAKTKNKPWAHPVARSFMSITSKPHRNSEMYSRSSVRLPREMTDEQLTWFNFHSATEFVPELYI